LNFISKNFKEKIMPVKIFILCFFLYVFLVPMHSQEPTNQSIDSAYFQNTIQKFSKGKNQRRYRFVKKFVKRNNLTNLSVKTEAIDWFGVYRNVIIEKKGDSDSIVYVVCHYDKVDGNIFTLANLMVNGNLDILLSIFNFSKGSYDNGSGVLISLSMLPWINENNTHYTYRFLFAGMEEYGLRGSRRHVAGIEAREWKKCFYTLNIDMVGKKGIKGVTVSENVSSPNLVKVAENVCNQQQIVLNKAQMPEGALSDYYSFQGYSYSKDLGLSLMANLSGAIIPQRSYFGEAKKAIPVINFTDDAKITSSEFIGMFLPLSFGEIHSFRDRPKVVSCNNLVDYHNFIKNYLIYIDFQKNIETENIK
jgi:hypothetical protein